jgi:alpha-tubulin suppressor-like RCC1 family protein
MATCGYFHTCVITENGEIWTCGSGTCGQLGHGTREHHIVPRSITNSKEPKKIDRFAKCLPTEEAAQTEGRERERREKERERREKEKEKEKEGERERLEYGTVLVAAGKLTSAISRTTSSISRTTSSISRTTRSDSEKERTSAIASCDASAGGLPFWGALILDVAAGPRHTVAVCSDGSLWSWGGGSEGQLGHGDMPKWRLTPLRIGREKFGGVPVVMADAGGF